MYFCKSKGYSPYAQVAESCTFAKEDLSLSPTAAVKWLLDAAAAGMKLHVFICLQLISCWAGEHRMMHGPLLIRVIY